MHEVFKEGTGYFVRIKDTDTPSGIDNVIPILGPSEKPPRDFGYSKEGENWQVVDLAVAVTGGVYRYAKSDRASGYFFTNVLCKSAVEARRRLKLPEGNEGDQVFRCRIEPTRVILGHMPGSNDTQMYVADTSKVVRLDTGSTIPPTS